MLKTIKHQRMKSKTQINGKTYYDHRLKDNIVRMSFLPINTISIKFHQDYFYRHWQTFKFCMEK